ncbi:hypothetical protein FOQG_15025 [Fusarium oxysporum f. sp. raphani 54005]|uniref:Uncharacterized protein n=1 Tax=Fusarium oxysporum f. sp. raphani 54005 TaxID=1089458 RepID=X0BNJ1_FUSOX|nr:hypothetical protein FOQG_15025 [Fusarium oxysporum f. sp. raphani 54005]
MHGNDREDVSHAAALMSHTAEPIRSSIQHSMNIMFRLFQLNVRKQGSAHESLINHKDIRDAAVLAIQEPQARQIQGKLLTVPMGHHGWLKMVLVTEREEEVPVESLDVTSAVIRLPERLIFMASVYVPGGDAQTLQDTCRKLGKAITGVKQWPGRAVDVVITSDFNRQDQMKGVDDVSVANQGVMDYRLDERIHASKPSPARRKDMGKRRLWETWTWFCLSGSLRTHVSKVRYMVRSKDQIIA